MAVSSISFSRTPQAGEDAFLWTEEEASAHLVGTNILSLDVMSNDLGGNAKKLYSIDDGNGNALAADSALLAKDVGVNGNPAGVSAWETTDDGNLIRINNGKIEFDLGHSLSVLGATDLNSMAAGDVIDDYFVYAIQLGNGTLSQAHVHVHIDGTNDSAAIDGTSIGTVTEDGAVQKVGGTLTVTDPDHDQNHFQTPTSLAGIYGTFTFNALTGEWDYTLNNSAANVQALGADDVRQDQLTVTSVDGTATQVIDVTVNGAAEQRPLDIVAGGVAYYYQSSLGVALHDGDGNFHSPTGYYNGTSFLYSYGYTYTQSLALGDFNGMAHSISPPEALVLPARTAAWVFC